MQPDRTFLSSSRPSSSSQSQRRFSSSSSGQPSSSTLRPSNKSRRLQHYSSNPSLSSSASNPNTNTNTNSLPHRPDFQQQREPNLEDSAVSNSSSSFHNAGPDYQPAFRPSSSNAVQLRTSPGRQTQQRNRARPSIGSGQSPAGPSRPAAPRSPGPSRLNPNYPLPNLQTPVPPPRAPSSNRDYYQEPLWSPHLPNSSVSAGVSGGFGTGSGAFGAAGGSGSSGSSSPSSYFYGQNQFGQSTTGDVPSGSAVSTPSSTVVSPVTATGPMAFQTGGSGLSGSQGQSQSPGQGGHGQSGQATNTPSKPGLPFQLPPAWSWGGSGMFAGSADGFNLGMDLDQGSDTGSEKWKGKEREYSMDASESVDDAEPTNTTDIPAQVTLGSIWSIPLPFPGTFTTETETKQNKTGNRNGKRKDPVPPLASGDFEGKWRIYYRSFDLDPHYRESIPRTQGDAPLTENANDVPMQEFDKEVPSLTNPGAALDSDLSALIRAIFLTTDSDNHDASPVPQRSSRPSPSLVIPGIQSSNPKIPKELEDEGSGISALDSGVGIDGPPPLKKARLATESEGYREGGTIPSSADESAGTEQADAKGNSEFEATQALRDEEVDPLERAKVFLDRDSLDWSYVTSHTDKLGQLQSHFPPFFTHIYTDWTSESAERSGPSPPQPPPPQQPQGSDKAKQIIDLDPESDSDEERNAPSLKEVPEGKNTTAEGLGRIRRELWCFVVLPYELEGEPMSSILKKLQSFETPSGMREIWNGFVTHRDIFPPLYPSPKFVPALQRSHLSFPSAFELSKCHPPSQNSRTFASRARHVFLNAMQSRIGELVSSPRAVAHLPNRNEENSSHQRVCWLGDRGFAVLPSDNLLCAIRSHEDGLTVDEKSHCVRRIEAWLDHAYQSNQSAGLAEPLPPAPLTVCSTMDLIFGPDGILVLPGEISRRQLWPLALPLSPSQRVDEEIEDTITRSSRLQRLQAEWTKEEEELTFQLRRRQDASRERDPTEPAVRERSKIRVNVFRGAKVHLCPAGMTATFLRWYGERWNFENDEDDSMATMDPQPPRSLLKRLERMRKQVEKEKGEIERHWSREWSQAPHYLDSPGKNCEDMLPGRRGWVLCTLDRPSSLLELYQKPSPIYVVWPVEFCLIDVSKGITSVPKPFALLDPEGDVTFTSSEFPGDEDGKASYPSAGLFDDLDTSVQIPLEHAQRIFQHSKPKASSAVTSTEDVVQQLASKAGTFVDRLSQKREQEREREKVKMVQVKQGRKKRPIAPTGTQGLGAAILPDSLTAMTALGHGPPDHTPALIIDNDRSPDEAKSLQITSRSIYPSPADGETFDSPIARDSVMASQLQHSLLPSELNNDNMLVNSFGWSSTVETSLTGNEWEDWSKGDVDMLDDLQVTDADFDFFDAPSTLADKAASLSTSAFNMGLRDEENRPFGDSPLFPTSSDDPSPSIGDSSVDADLQVPQLMTAPLASSAPPALISSPSGIDIETEHITQTVGPWDSSGTFVSSSPLATLDPSLANEELMMDAYPTEMSINDGRHYHSTERISKRAPSAEGTSPPVPKRKRFTMVPPGYEVKPSPDSPTAALNTNTTIKTPPSHDNEGSPFSPWSIRRSIPALDYIHPSGPSRLPSGGSKHHSRVPASPFDFTSMTTDTARARANSIAWYDKFYNPKMRRPIASLGPPKKPMPQWGAGAITGKRDREGFQISRIPTWERGDPSRQERQSSVGAEGLAKLTLEDSDEDSSISSLSDEGDQVQTRVTDMPSQPHDNESDDEEAPSISMATWGTELLRIRILGFRLALQSFPLRDRAREKIMIDLEQDHGSRGTAMKEYCDQLMGDFMQVELQDRSVMDSDAFREIHAFMSNIIFAVQSSSPFSRGRFAPVVADHLGNYSIVASHQNWLAKMSPVGLRFWKTITLEPLNGPKHVFAAVVLQANQNGLEDDARQWLRSLGPIYQTLLLGKFELCTTPRIQDGVAILPDPFQDDDPGQSLSQVCTALVSSTPNYSHPVLYVISSPVNFQTFAQRASIKTAAPYLRVIDPYRTALTQEFSLTRAFALPRIAIKTYDSIDLPTHRHVPKRLVPVNHSNPEDAINKVETEYFFSPSFTLSLPEFSRKVQPDTAHPRFKRLWPAPPLGSLMDGRETRFLFFGYCTLPPIGASSLPGSTAEEQVLVAWEDDRGETRQSAVVSTDAASIKNKNPHNLKMRARVEAVWRAIKTHIIEASDRVWKIVIIPAAGLISWSEMAAWSLLANSKALTAYSCPVHVTIACLELNCFSTSLSLNTRSFSVHEQHEGISLTTSNWIRSPTDSPVLVDISNPTVWIAHLPSQGLQRWVRVEDNFSRDIDSVPLTKISMVMAAFPASTFLLHPFHSSATGRKWVIGEKGEGISGDTWAPCECHVLHIVQSFHTPSYKSFLAAARQTSNRKKSSSSPMSNVQPGDESLDEHRRELVSAWTGLVNLARYRQSAGVEEAEAEGLTTLPAFFKAVVGVCLADGGKS